MFLQQAAQMPVVINVRGKRLQVPKFKTKDWLDWATEIDNTRLTKATKDMKPEEKFRMLTAYNILPTDVVELKNWVDTPQGTIRITRTCLQRALVIGTYDENNLEESYRPIDNPEPITKELVVLILTETVFSNLVVLARILADVQNTATMSPPPTPPKLPTTEEGEEETLDQEAEGQGVESFLTGSSKEESIA